MKKLFRRLLQKAEHCIEAEHNEKDGYGWPREIVAGETVCQDKDLQAFEAHEKGLLAVPIEQCYLAAV